MLPIALRIMPQILLTYFSFLGLIFAQNGRWLNKGLTYDKCRVVDRPSYDKMCSNYTLNNYKLDVSSVESIDCNEMYLLILCSLRQMNCDDWPRSLQMIDVPCQASCISAIDYCKEELSSIFTKTTKPTDTADYSDDFYEEPFYYDNFSDAQSSSSYVEASGKLVDTTPSPNQKWLWNSKYVRKSINPFPNKIKQYEQNNNQIYDQPTYNRFMPRMATYQRYNHPNQRFDQNLYYDRNPRNKRQTNYLMNQQKPLNHLMDGKSEDFLPISFPLQSDEIDFEKYKECNLLPLGVCHDWTKDLSKFITLNLQSHQYIYKKNPGCPVDQKAKCARMFPKQFRKNDWVNGNFTIASQIKISQTIWWFGKDDATYQPKVSFNMQKTFLSDIENYDEKTIVTLRWPLKCGCEEEISPGDVYIMLTHSNKIRHKLDLSENTVFLRRPEVYSKRLLCWTQNVNCIRRRYPRRFNAWNRTRRYLPQS